MTPDASRLGNETVERQLVGALMRYPESLIDAMPLAPEHFTDDRWAIVFREIKATDRAGIYEEYREENYGIFARYLITRMSPRDQEVIGGESTLVGIQTDHATIRQNIREYAGIVRSLALARSMIQRRDQLNRELCAQDQPTEEIVARWLADTAEILSSHSTVDPCTLADAVEIFWDSLQKRRDGVEPGIPTGLADLDAVIDGLQPGRLIVVAGRTSMGKSTLSLNIAEHAVFEQDVPTLYLSVEMSQPELVGRIVSRMTQIPHQRIADSKKLRPDEVATIQSVLPTIAGSVLQVEDSPVQTLESMATRIRVAFHRDSVRLVIVDLIQRLTPTPAELKRWQMREYYGQATKLLKDLARELQIPIIAVSQLNRETDKQERPTLSNLAESARIEQDADQVILLHRPDYYKAEDEPGLIQAFVAKNRHGATKEVRLTHKLACNCIVNRSEKDESPEFLHKCQEERARAKQEEDQTDWSVIHGNTFDPRSANGHTASPELF